MPFRVFDKLKNEIQSFIVRFRFHLNMKNKIQIIGLATISMFNGVLLWIFNAFICFSIFIKNRKRNTARFSFFIFMKEWKTNYLKWWRLTLWLFSQVWFMQYSRASSCQVYWDFPLFNGHRDTKNPLFRKQLMYFNVYIIGCCFHISRSSHCKVVS